MLVALLESGDLLYAFVDEILCRGSVLQNSPPPQRSLNRCGLLLAASYPNGLEKQGVFQKLAEGKQGATLLLIVCGIKAKSLASCWV